jgi:heparan-alpha-glucosaminide N-acetyltransferase
MRESVFNKPTRLVSLDAYRGFVMLAMVSGGLGFARIVEDHPEVLSTWDGTAYASAWRSLWRTLAYQFEHVAWTGCSFWDLIQPSFMFMVGVALPFSFARRQAEGQTRWRQFGHVLFRSLVLIALGVFLSSNGSRQTNFTFVNVLTQIGLGYTFVWLLVGRRFALQAAALVLILAGYWFYFYQYSMPAAEREQVAQYLTEVRHKGEAEWTQFSGLAAHWNKHTNAAAAFDRWFLNLFPRGEEGGRFVVNEGGYQTLNFIPSIATMLLGLMAGQLLRGKRSQWQKVRNLLLAGLGCFAVAMALDTSIWPVRIAGFDWSVCPIVKRIWTPTWVLFSGGWTFCMLAAFYWAIDLVGWRRWAFPLVVVGMNSIAIYVMAQLLKPWISKTARTHLTTVDAAYETNVVPTLFGDSSTYSPLWEALLRLGVLWLVCLWMYRRRIFIRI